MIVCPPASLVLPALEELHYEQLALKQGSAERLFFALLAN